MPKNKTPEIVSLKPGDIIPIDTMTTITGTPYNLKNTPGKIIHIYLGRFSGCVNQKNLQFPLQELFRKRNEIGK